MFFVGIDLAWSPRRTSGVAVFSGDQTGAVLEGWRSNLLTVTEVVEFVEGTTRTRPALLAVDAPLVVKNRTGMRECDRIVSSLFRTYKAGVIPVNRSNLGRYDGFEGERLVAKLEERGYRHAVPLLKGGFRGFFETYPHAASIVLFGLSERLPYKVRGTRRTREVRNTAYLAYQRYLRGLRDASPGLVIDDELLQRDVDRLPEPQLKAYEDLLDSILCAYVSLYYWTWGTSKCSVLGSVENGYMVLPTVSYNARRLGPHNTQFEE